MSSTKRIARERSYRNRHSASHRGILGDPDRIDEDGVLGEAAFADAFGFEHKAIKRKRPSHSGNFELRDHTRVDVRSSRARYAKLIVPPKVAKRKSIDAYVLAEITQSGKAILRGWATRDDVLQAPVKDISLLPGAEPVHVIYQHDLREMETLLMRHIPTTKSLFDLE